MSLLTPREREILGYIARGLAKKEMARLAGISVKTVEQHCVHIMDKLDIRSRGARPLRHPRGSGQRVIPSRADAGRRRNMHAGCWRSSLSARNQRKFCVLLQARKRPTAGSSAAFIAFWMPASRLSTHIGGARGAARGA